MRWLYSPRVLNNVVVIFGSLATTPTQEQQEAILEAMIRLLDPDHAVATSHEVLDRAGVERPWEAGWLTYQRGGDLHYHSQ